MRKQVKLLVNDADPQSLRIMRVIDGDRRAIYKESAAVGCYCAGDNFGQSALASTVLSHQPVNLACEDRETGPLQGKDAVKTFIDFAELENGLGHRSKSFLTLR